MLRESVARQRETKEREGFVISVAESMSMKSRRNSIRSHSLKEISEDILNEELNKLFLMKIQFREHYARLSTTRRSKILERRNSEYSLF